MNPNFTIIGVGSPIVDSIAQIEESFLDHVGGEKGGMLLTDAVTIGNLIQRIPNRPHAAPGGSAGNTLFALARMGASTSFLGKIGNCERGHFYRTRFSELGGDALRFKVGDAPNGHCLSLVTPDGERTMRTDLGAAMTLTPDEVSAADFAGCTHAHIEGYLLFNTELMQRVIESAKEAGCSISLDLASFEVVHAARDTLPAILQEYVDIVFANEEEASAFTGLEDDYAAMAEQLGGLCDIAAVKVGAQGSYIAAEGAVQKIAPVPAGQVLDTTGAGDLWAAGFLYGWSRKQALHDCARLGSILGSAVVQTRGSELSEEVWSSILSEI
ncbi:adenosine kinase [Coraliomargarita sinensis]|uniref:Adenosine kinase n=1 Tax=Coraliomargarita sinensis TaxID=2174842 RepID=A0A317ZI77_9BACT|nr:adenosine kinase [Coraliomargarita sinensis]PXA03608.1 adenosine kinase [Coraliomargarita sinensis]